MIADFTMHRLRAAGRRFGLEECDKADRLMREAHSLGRLTEDFVDQVYDAVDADIRNAVEQLAPQIPEEKRAVFDKAARRAWRRYAREHAEQ